VNDHLLVLDAGSSSLKFAVDAIEPDRLVERLFGQVEGIGTIGHRVVHGGPTFSAPAAPLLRPGHPLTHPIRPSLLASKG